MFTEETNLKSFYRLIQGDCLKVLPTLKTWSVDSVITDPPYGFNRFKNDNKYFIKLIKWSFQEIKRILKRGKTAFVFCSPNKNLPKIINAICLDFQRILWMYKPNDETFPWGRWLQTSEAILVFSNGKMNHKDINKETYVHDVYTHKNVGHEGIEGHPVVKPLKIIEDLVKTSNEEDLILDPFLGSGTTMLASENTRRNCIGIEINPEYCEIVKKRCFGRQFLDRKVEYKFEVFN